MIPSSEGCVLSRVLTSVGLISHPLLKSMPLDVYGCAANYGAFFAIIFRLLRKCSGVAWVCGARGGHAVHRPMKKKFYP